MLRLIQDALAYLQAYRGRIFVVKLGRDVFERAEEVGISQDINLLAGAGLRLAVTHPVSGFDLADWPSLYGAADIRGARNMRGILHSLEIGRIPIIYCKPGKEEDGDWAAADFAVKLHADKLVFLSNYDGVTDENGKLVRQITVERAKELLTVKGPANSYLRSKLECALWAFERGVLRIHIINGMVEDVLFAEMLTSEGIGTMVYGKEPYTILKFAEKIDGLAILDIIRTADFPTTADSKEIIRRTSSFRVRLYDDTVHGCVLYTRHRQDEALELSYLATSRVYEDGRDAELLLEDAVSHARKYGFRHIFMETTKTQIWIGIYPWFLKWGFKRRKLKDVFQSDQFKDRQDKEIWHTSL